MSNDWFTDVCTTLVGVDGRALTGAARDAAEKALQAAKIANHKIWTDRFGNYYHRERSLFASGMRLVDEFGNPVLRVRNCDEVVEIAPRRTPVPKADKSNPRTADPLAELWWILDLLGL